MNENQLIVFEYLKEENFQTGIIELEGEYESIPQRIYEYYNELSYSEKLSVLREVLDYQLKNTPKYVLDSKG
ncbi:hypothetical protein BH753_gp008 [Bacillus phage Shbh1]|uniref:Uncharacterized protein n=1 Tax=Bacillus phage Shbh1 TaxID=1796992 RepID=A0A142F133_9CAUD|nr:hypothetical protein BH753_gp008 [Bacillus phage Shbh1]AMQ66490.1 hypothetical protein [Bacillus phage Shbh1]